MESNNDTDERDLLTVCGRMGQQRVATCIKCTDGLTILYLDGVVQYDDAVTPTDGAVGHVNGVCGRMHDTLLIDTLEASG